MRAVATKNSSPELIVRKLLTEEGYRYRLHRKDLPGTPDIVFPSRKVALFVNGCFWHSHARCPRGRVPASNLDYWLPKLKRNRERDAWNTRALKKAGWRVVTIWECELRNPIAMMTKLSSALNGASQG